MNIRERTLVLVKDGEVEVGYTEGPVIMNVVGIVLEKPDPKNPYEFLTVKFIYQNTNGLHRDIQSFCKFRMVPLVSLVRDFEEMSVEGALQIYRNRLSKLPRDIRIRVNKCTQGIMVPLAPL